MLLTLYFLLSTYVALPLISVRLEIMRVTV